MPFIYTKCKATNKPMESYFSKNKKYEVGDEHFDFINGREIVVTRVKFTKDNK